MRTTTPCVFLSLKAACFARAFPVDRQQDDHRDVGEGQQFEEDAPEARAPLLLERRGRQLLDHAAFPMLAVVSHLRLP
jgi:hypothetical protein